MGFEVTYNCDICGTIGGGASTREEASRRMLEEGWQRLRVDNELKLVCKVCIDDYGGKNGARRVIRRNKA
jgi:hypothetical protein